MFHILTIDVKQTANMREIIQNKTGRQTTHAHSSMNVHGKINLWKIRARQLASKRTTNAIALARTRTQ